MKIIKFTAFAAAVLTAASALSSCGIIRFNKRSTIDTTDTSSDAQRVTDTANSDEIPVSPSTPAQTYEKVIKSGSEEDITAAVNNLPEADFGGGAFQIAVVEGGSYSSYFPDTNDNAVNIARLKINQLVAEKYNTDILPVKATSDEVIVDEMRKADAAQDIYADMVAFSASKLGYYISSELLMNMNSVPFVDYEEDYYNGDAIIQMTGGNKTFAIAGSATDDPRFRYVICYNKTLAESVGIEDPYELVKSGKWTWDKLAELSIQIKNAGLDDESEGKLWGTVSDEHYEILSDIVRSCYGIRFLWTGMGHAPQVAYETEVLDRAAQFCKNFIYNDNAYLECYDQEFTALEKYGRGGSVFWIGKLYEVQELANTGKYVGVLPLPARDDGKTVRSYTDADLTLVFSAPKNIATVDNIGLFLEAYNTAAYRYLNNSAVSHMAYNAVSDNRSLGVLDTILSTDPFYDLAYMISEQYKAVAEATVNTYHAGIKQSFSTADYRQNYLNGASYQLDVLFPLTNAE